MRLREVADRFGGWVAPESGDLEISGLAALAEANPGDLSFYGRPKYLRALRKSRATAVLVPHGFSEEVPPVRIWVDDPAASFAELLSLFAPTPIAYATGIHPTAIMGEGTIIGEGASIGPYAVIEPGVCIGRGSRIGAHCYIGHQVVIGEDCHLHPQVTIRERCILGNRICLHSGVVIGADGFGYEFRDGHHEKVPQTGIVRIDDDVEIGANSTVDRARFGRTWIQKGTKIDNLVQIGHNVTIGEHCILCAQVGISGSTRIGSFVTIAGKVGLNGHIEVGDGATICAMSGVTQDVSPKAVLLGIPARPIRDFKLNFALGQNLQKLYERVKALEQQIKSEV